MTNLSTYIRSYDPFLVGFDRIFNQFNQLETYNTSYTSSGYPPYDIVRNEENYTINLACAGFTEEDLSVELKEGSLSISGEIKDKETDVSNYLHKGIGTRKFKRSFTLAETVEVRNVSLNNGVLSVEMENVLPEHKRPKKFAINTGDSVLTKVGKKTKQLLTE